ncbi:MAG: iron ABC transporter permease [Alphaproteobacteria bacterium]|nr:iron ABC transporter permease [Alphaproteobacteria bacterium]
MQAAFSQPPDLPVRAAFSGRSIGRRLFGGTGLGLTATVIALVLALPIAVVIVHLFVPQGETWRHLASTVLSRYVINTAWLVFGVGLGTLVFGVASAWLVTMYRFPFRRIFEWALLLPLAVPGYAIAYAYAGLFEFAGPVQTGLRETFGLSHGNYWFPEFRSLGGATFILSVGLYPYVYMLARSAFLAQSICALEIGRTLGLGPFGIFWRVGLPLARPAIVAGIAFALMETLSDFGAVQHLGVDTFTTGIYRTWFALGDATAAAQLAVVLLAVVAFVLGLERVMRGKARFEHTSRRYRPLEPIPLRPARAFLAFMVCLVPIGFGFLLPCGQLLAWAIRSASSVIDDRFALEALNSLWLALATAALAVAIALVMAYAGRAGHGPITRIAARLGSLGYAVPGSVIAIGVLMLLAWVDDGLGAIARSLFGLSPGLLIGGTVAALMFAYVVRFLAVSLKTVDAALTKVTPSMDGAARALGASPSGAIIRVHAPLISGGLLTAGLLVLVDTMKELPATLILRPFDFNTLAVRAYEFASDEQLREAAVPALLIVLVGLMPVALISRAIARARPGHHEGVGA